jgi:hypothetical protein
LGGKGSIGLNRKQPAVTPDIRTVTGHIKGQISKDLHPQLIGKASHRLPLLIQMPLQQPLGF